MPRYHERDDLRCSRSKCRKEYEIRYLTGSTGTSLTRTHPVQLCDDCHPDFLEAVERIRARRRKKTRVRLRVRLERERL